MDFFNLFYLSSREAGKPDRTTVFQATSNMRNIGHAEISLRSAPQTRRHTAENFETAFAFGEDGLEVAGHGELAVEEDSEDTKLFGIFGRGKGFA